MFAQSKIAHKVLLPRILPSPFLLSLLSDWLADSPLLFYRASCNILSCPNECNYTPSLILLADLRNSAALCTSMLKIHTVT
jgi:hypothetical protein